MKPKRGPERVAVEWRTNIRRNGATIGGRALDVSKTGILLIMGGRVRVGELVEVDMITGKNSFCRATARIVREAFKIDGKTAYGVRFVDMMRMDQETLSAAISAANPRPVRAVLLG